MERRQKRTEKQEYYLAQIVVAIERLFMEDPDKLQIEDRLLSFKTADEEKRRTMTVEIGEDEDEDYDEEEEKVDYNKILWMARLGLTPDVKVE